MNYKKTIKNQPQKSKIILNSQADADKPVCNPPAGAGEKLLSMFGISGCTGFIVNSNIKNS
jgi:hypothetical protein